MPSFALEQDDFSMKRGWWARTERTRLTYEGREIMGFTEAPLRPYVFPLYSPSGHLVTSECPADHPHHNSLWVAADHVTIRMPVTGGYEDYTYNIYLDETFQGRAPGRIEQLSLSGEQTAEARYIVTQELCWRGPPEWGAREGRTALRETRRTIVEADGDSYTIDVESTLSAQEWHVVLGPTRHAYFHLRLAESMWPRHGGRLINDTGGPIGDGLSGAHADWVDFSGPVGGGAWAGVSVFRDPCEADNSWFVTDWGVVTTGGFRTAPLHLAAGASTTMRCRFVVHDGCPQSDEISARHRRYRSSFNPA